MTKPLAAASTKAYFGAQQTRAWVAGVAALAPRADALGVEIAVLPSFPLLESTAAALDGTDISYGAQAAAPSDIGAQTGGVTVALLAELGCRYVEIGHAERRKNNGETDAVVRELCQLASSAGLVPLLCVGEPEHGDPEQAAHFCVGQLRDALQELPEAEVVVAYEPIWAIGADAPASPEHVRVVGAALKRALAERQGAGRVIYGGTAGPGLVARLGDSVDGLFLGRRAHDVAAFAAVVDEIGATLGG